MKKSSKIRAPQLPWMQPKVSNDNSGQDIYSSRSNTLYSNRSNKINTSNNCNDIVNENKSYTIESSLYNSSSKDMLDTANCNLVVRAPKQLYPITCTEKNIWLREQMSFYEKLCDKAWERQRHEIANIIKQRLQATEKAILESNNVTQKKMTEMWQVHLEKQNILVREEFNRIQNEYIHSDSIKNKINNETVNPQKVQNSFDTKRLSEKDNYFDETSRLNENKKLSNHLTLTQDFSVEKGDIFSNMAKLQKNVENLARETAEIVKLSTTKKNAETFKEKRYY